MNLRSGPGTGYQILQVVGPGTPVDGLCETWGTNVGGNSLWWHLTGGQWVADDLVDSPGYNTLSPPYRWC